MSSDSPLLVNTTTANAAWIEIVKALEEPKRSAAQNGRGGSTRELLKAVVSISSPRDRWIIARNPPINPAFAIAEVLWILAGREDSGFLTFFNSRLPAFAGQGSRFHGAYGFRLRNALGFDQLRRAYTVLRRNPESRQVVLQIWDGRRDFPRLSGAPVAADVPCNTLAMLKVRRGRLEWTQVLRSNDVAMGFPYNVIQFTTLQEIVAGWLDVDVGGYVHFADSLHAYERDLRNISARCDEPIQENTDRFELSYQHTQKIVGRAVDSIADGLSSTRATEEFATLIESDRQIPHSFKNILRIVAAEMHRRHGAFEAARAVAERCTNPILRQVWRRWSDRVDLNPERRQSPPRRLRPRRTA